MDATVPPSEITITDGDEGVEEEKEIKPKKLNFRQLKKQPKIRRNALQVKKDIEDEEAEIISKEKIWEEPTFLRKKGVKG